ncbi:hypothetical protein AtNW77_Chr2g0251501 [Arabidopsis thaliana]|uniref:Uncharacterized protein n=3 Tax=Arabidopsis TaxID=3701 RepID=A0A178VZG9_ARATH|nr:hypothetical protein ISN45_At02g025810 [Arabidopsis thaliana x Arabidopsis arenosa]KAG7642729.1 hypothetical protein ISN44_As02g026130 [Arabidopsis suecica]OAP10483.1 hypothetical protein AXX17_AT2G27730 [Arabidopsis thaliana]
MASTGGGKDGSKGFVKRVTSTFSIRKKKNTTSDPKLLLPRSKSTGANYESMRLPQGKKALPDVVTTKDTKRTKSAGVSPQPRREKIDESGKQFMKVRCFDDSDSIWLSSDCASPTSLLEERRLSVSFHFSVDEKIISWLSSVASSSLSLNQEPTSSNKENHHQKSSKNTKSSLENVRKDGKVCNSSAGKTRGTDSAKPSLPESNNKTCPQKPCEETSISNRFVTLEEKKVSFSVEETEKSPSPGNSTATATSSLIKKSAEIGVTKSKIVVEPLFWPFEQKFDWTPEDILKHFSMSPRRKKSLGSKIAGTSPRSMRAQLQTRKLDLKEGCKRKLMFNGPGSNSKPTRIPELNRTISNSSNNSSTKKTEISKNQQPMRNSVKRNKSLPSRLRKSSKISSKVVPIEAAEESGEIVKEQKTPKKLIMTRKSRTFLEDDFALMNDFSIEKAVGLCEFKGREGIDSDFNTDGFLFDDSL